MELEAQSPHDYRRGGLTLAQVNKVGLPPRGDPGRMLLFHAVFHLAEAQVLIEAGAAQLAVLTVARS